MTARADFRFFAPFTKVARQPDGSLLVHAILNDETVDDQGEIVDYAGGKAALDDFMKWANVREMHQPSAVGLVEALVHDDEAKASEAILRVVDPVAVTKVETGVYKGTSLGGSKGSARALEKVGGAFVTRLLAPIVKEVSLVDRPSRPTAVLTLAKRAEPTFAERVEASDDHPANDMPGDGDMSDEATTAPAETGKMKQSEPDSLAEPPALAVAEPAPAKGAADDLTSVHIAKESIARLIEKESAEGDSDQVAPLKAALAALDAFESSEAEELGTPEDTEAAATEAIPVAVMDMAYAAVIADLGRRSATLAKAGARNAAGDQQKLDQIHDLAVAAGAYPADHGPSDSPDEGDPAEKLAKGTGFDLEALADTIMTKLATSAPYARAADLAAVKDEILAAFVPLKEDLAKIAAQPTNGGPLRFVDDPRRLFGPDEGPAGATFSEALHKAAQKTTDPALREELGRLAAAQEIAAMRGR